MTNVYFNEVGYFIQGGGVEIARSCPPLSDPDTGKGLLEPTHHLYAVLISALQELENHEEDITVFNDSRIIEEMDGATPLDDVCQDSRLFIRRNVLSLIPSLVWFKKKDGDWVNRHVQNGIQKMIGTVDVGQRDKAARKLALLVERKRASAKKARVRSLQRR